MILQNYLRRGGTFDGLLTAYGITAKRHSEYPNLVLFKYNQIASPMHEPIVRESRGVILDEDDDWRVVARAFDKFFNHGEPLAAEIDWATARVQEKLDGSLATVYYYDNCWHVATTGTPDASGDINGSGATFASYFWGTLGVEPGEFPCSKSGICFLFELMGPANRIVVVHPRPRLVLLGARIRDNGQELTSEVARIYVGADNVEVVREYPLNGFDDILTTFGTLSPLAQEGYVVVDAAFRRVKVKHPGYVALHRAKDGLSRRAFVEIARTGETPEVIAAFPELRPMLDDARSRLDALVAEVEADYKRIQGIPVQKDFAMEATGTACPAAMFQIRSGKVKTARDFFAQMPIDSLMRLLGYKH